MLWLLLVAVIVVLIGVFEHFRTRRMMAILNDIPTIKSYPLVGSAFEFGSNSVDYMSKMISTSNEMGPIWHAWLGKFVYVVLSDAKDIEAVLSSKTHLTKSYLYTFMKDWLGLGLITAPADHWRPQRRVLTPAFHFQILEKYISVMCKNTDIMMQQLEKEVGKETFEIKRYVDNCTLDVICETSMATSVNAQINEYSEFPKAIKLVSNAIMERIFKPWLFPEFIFKMSAVGRIYYKNLDYINTFVDNVIVERKKEFEQIKKDTSHFPVEEKSESIYGDKQRNVFLDLLLLYAEDPAVTLTDRNIRDEVNTFIFAGHDTTSSVISFAIHLLGKHPEVQEKLFEEVNQVFGKSNTIPTLQEFKELKYMEQVIRETLRLYPPVPYISRCIKEDLKLPSGYIVPAGAEVVVMIYNLQRDPNVFPNPDNFNPDNFTLEKAGSKPPYSYVPFSAGPRNCIGQKFAMLEVKSTLAKLVQTYKITSVDQKLVLASEIILRSQKGINVRLEKRN